MKYPIRYQSHLLFRKSTKPNRVIRIRLAQRLNVVFRPKGAGPQIKRSERETEISPEVHEEPPKTCGSLGPVAILTPRAFHKTVA